MSDYTNNLSGKVKKAKKMFNELPDKEKEIALTYIENKLLGKTKENEKIKENLA